MEDFWKENWLLANTTRTALMNAIETCHTDVGESTNLLVVKIAEFCQPHIFEKKLRNFDYSKLMLQTITSGIINIDL